MIAVVRHALHHPSLFAEFCSATLLVSIFIVGIWLASRAERRELERDAWKRSPRPLRVVPEPHTEGLELSAGELYAEHTGNTDYLGGPS